MHTLLANDYPKLEILVLDDCSQDKTAEIIKSFAHAGVRFVKGDEPSDRWLPKNQAYDKLLREANGDLILFCGVDVRLGPGAVRSLVATLLSRNKSMISVMPVRYYSSFDAAFVQPMRYWWELVPPRRLFNRPPTLSTCWLANRKMLHQIGGFAAVARTILPEGYFARKFVLNDQYSFIRADSELDVQTSKGLREQTDTALRMRYPQLKRRPELVLLLCLLELLFLFSPFLLLLYSLLSSKFLLLGVSIATCGLLMAVHVAIIQVSNPSNIPMALVNFLFVVLSELVISLVSMAKYELGTINWKGRNICVPVMHTRPHLPKF